MTAKRNPAAPPDAGEDQDKAPSPLAIPVLAQGTASGETDQGFPIVGIGASAGGLSAFESFFSGMPEGLPGMAFVLVQHLAPDHESLLTEIIRRCTTMQVFEAEDGMVVRPNCVYIIPPNRAMALQGDALQVTEPALPHGRRLPIDFFFCSLAQARHERAIGIVLSGTGSDGTLGLRAIKGEGGMVMAQGLEDSEYDGMPRSALATGLVDYELPPADMPAQLMAYGTHPLSPPGAALVLGTKAEIALKRIFASLRTQTGHDFASYKPSTIHRRLQRRLAVLQIETLEGYAASALSRIGRGLLSKSRPPAHAWAYVRPLIAAALQNRPPSGATLVS